MAEQIDTLEPTQPAGRSRDAGIEAGRFVMALAVVGLHVVSLRSTAFPVQASGLAFVVATVGRAAVPFFFVLSGFFLRKPRSLVEAIRRPAVRLLPIYVAWFVLYWVAAHVAYIWWPWSLTALVNGGGAFQLWFLTGLLAAHILVGLVWRHAGLRAAVALSIVLILIGPIAAQYLPLLTGIAYPAKLLPLGRHFAAPLFVTLGVVLQGRARWRPMAAAAAFVVSLAAVMTEEWLLGRWLGLPKPLVPDVVVGTVPLGVAAFWLARSLGDAWPARRLAPLGRLSLSIYLVHVMILWALLPHIASSALLTVVVCGIAIATSYLLQAIPGVRRLVR